MDQFSDFGASNEETEPKIGIYEKKKLSKIGPTENFHLSQKSKSIVKDSKSLLKSTKANVAKKR